ncbi:MAG: hypothetical protein C0395_09265 [Gemmatimonas sp.]|nr:hypothetical protein [Gemmatimonas sp.]
MEISFLTRPGCANGPLMAARLRAAIEAHAIEATVTIIDASTLPSEDERTGYGTPTVLVAGRDLFGHSTPGAAAPT